MKPEKLIAKYRPEIAHKKSISLYPQAVLQIYVDHLDLETLLNEVERLTRANAELVAFVKRQGRTALETAKTWEA